LGLFLEATLQTIILLLGIGLFAVAAYGDIRTLRIPNALAGTVAAVGVLRLIVIGDPNAAMQTTAATAIVLIVAFLLFWRNLIGGGDAKLIAAAALLVGYNNLFNFLLVMGLCGGLVSLVVLVTQRRSSAKLVRRIQLGEVVETVAAVGQLSALSKARVAIPYGVAIAGGAIVTLLDQVLPLLFQPSLHG
jgi:prepilin peptidase CpaA